MKQYMALHPFVKTGVFALALLPFLVIINMLSPEGTKVPTGYSSSILAFEFATSYQEIQEVLSPLTTAEIRDLDMLNYVDFGFMVAYSTFLYLFMRRAYQEFGYSYLKYLMNVPILICLADVVENLQLLKLTELYSSASPVPDYSSPLSYLSIFTWVKWVLLAITFAAISISLYRQGRLAKAISWLSWMPLGLLTYFLMIQTRASADQFASSIFLIFLLLALFCFLYKKEQHNAPLNST